MPVKRTNLVKPFAQVVFLSLGMLCALSRIFDYWHHWEDVIVGLLLGTLVAFFIVSGNIRINATFPLTLFEQYLKIWFQNFTLEWVCATLIIIPSINSLI